MLARRCVWPSTRSTYLRLTCSSSAREYGVNEPTDPSCWADDSEAVSSPEEVTFWLTRKGQGKLRASIREQRRKDWQFWIYLITALTGLGGTIIGIISA